MSLTHIWDDNIEDDIISSTELFWSDIINNEELSYMITPDCRIASGFHQRAIGVNGIDNCLRLLTSLQRSLCQAEVDTEMQNLMRMKTGTQTRFYIKGKYMGKPWTLSFALEWSNGIIVGIVIIKGDKVDDGFLKDELDYSFTANGTLGRRGSLCEDYSTNFFFMGGTLDPPYHLPIPPGRLATVVVTVLNCKNLKSRLKRLFTRPINPQVVLEFNGRQQETCVLKKTCNPVFITGGGEEGTEHSNPFVFEVPETLDERDPNACIKFMIKDIHGFGEVSDLLSAVKVPLAAIKCQTSIDTPIKMTIPVKIRRRHFGIRESVGIKTKNDNVAVSRPDDIVPKSNDERDVTSLTVLISKTDDLKLWLLRELQVRDEIWQADVLAERERNCQENEKCHQNETESNEQENSLRALLAKESSPVRTYANHRKPASDETNYSKLFPPFLWSLRSDMYA